VKKNVLSFVAFAAMIALGVGYIWSLGVRIGPPENRTLLSMDVPDINGLLVGSNVLLRGVPVGKITGIRTTVTDATVDFYVDDKYRIPVDSEFRLESLSALGEPYIGLVPHTNDGPVLQNGQRITMERIVLPPSISELAVNLSRVLSQADPEALRRVVGEFDTGLPDPTTTLPNIARASKMLRNVAADMNGRGRDLLDNFQTLLQNAGWVGPLLADITPQVQSVGVSTGVLLSGLRIGRPLGAPDIFIQVNHLIDRIQRLLDNNGGDLRVLGEALLPHLQGIAGSLMNYDTGQILSNVLESVPADGVVTLRVSNP
jgi:virulence factor Mce-like protein